MCTVHLKTKLLQQKCWYSRFVDDTLVWVDITIDICETQLLIDTVNEENNIID